MKQEGIHKPDINKIKVIDVARGYMECVNYCDTCKNVFGSCKLREKKLKQAREGTVSVRS